MDLRKLHPDQLIQTIRGLRTENSTQLASGFVKEIMRGPLRDAHDADAGPIEFDHFDTNPTVGAGVITGTVGAADVVLFASTSASNEAGLIVIDDSWSKQWTFGAGTGGSTGWGFVSLDWSIDGVANFQSQYNATPHQGGYGTLGNFAVNFRGKRFKPLHSKTIASGGNITARLAVRPLGVAGQVVIWPGADLQAISSAACNLIQRMQPFSPTTYGPVQTRGLFKPDVAADGPGRKALISQALGRGRLGDLVKSVHGLIDPSREPPR